MYYEIVKDERFYSRKNKSHYDYYMEVCSFICKYPHEIKAINCELII